MQAQLFETAARNVMFALPGRDEVAGAKLGANHPAVNQASDNEPAQSAKDEDGSIRLGDDRVRQAEEQTEKQANGPTWNGHFHTTDD